MVSSKSSHPLRDEGTFDGEWWSTIQSPLPRRYTVLFALLQSFALSFPPLENNGVIPLVTYPILHGRQSCLVPLGFWGIEWLVLSNHVPSDSGGGWPHRILEHTVGCKTVTINKKGRNGLENTVHRLPNTREVDHGSLNHAATTNRHTKSPVHAKS